jgi:hypothetical protein
MYVEHLIKPGQVTFITLTYDASVDLTVKAETSKDQIISIESDDLILTYDSKNSKVDEGVLFSLTDKVTGEKNPIGFGLRFWKSNQANGGFICYLKYKLEKIYRFFRLTPPPTYCQNSGAYIFRAVPKQFDSTVYSHFDSIKVAKSSIRSEFVVYFTSKDKKSGDALVKI